MSILKAQSGATIPAYINYTPVVTSDASASARTTSDESASSSSKKSEGITDKDLLKALDSLDALPNEVKQITSEILNFIVDTQMSLGEIDPAALSLKYAALVGKIKIAKFNAKLYENAYDLIKSNGGLPELAIDADGLILCRSRSNPNEYEKFTDEEYIANYKEYKALTNLELLDLRALSPGLVDNNSVLQIVSNGIGITGILKLVNDAITRIGTTTMLELGYTLTQLLLIARGMEYLQEAALTSGSDPSNGMQVDGIYNLGVLSKDLQVQALMALNYIYSTLPKNAKTLLTVKAAENGVPGGAKGLINLLIQSKLDVTQTQKLSRSNNPSDKKSKSGKTTDVPEGVDPAFAKLALTPVMMAQLGLGERKLITMNQGSSYSATCYGQVIPIVSKTGEAIGANSTLLEVSLSQLAGALNLEDATMGGARISQDAIRKVAVTSSNMYIVNIPIDKNRTDGVIAPDLRYLNRVQLADKQIEAWKASHNGQITVEEVNKIYENNKLPLLMDASGNINTTNYCKFAVFNGEVKDKYLIPPPDGSDIIALDITSEENVQNYKDILSGNKETKSQEEFDFNEWYDFNGHDTLYRATIYVPLSTNIVSGAATSGTNLTVSDAVGIYAKNELKARTSNVKDGRQIYE